MQLAPSIDHSSPPSELAEILRPEVNVWTVRRGLGPSVAQALERVAAGEVFERAGRVDASAVDLSELLEEVSDPLARDFLDRDVARLVREWAGVLGRRHLHASLAVVRTDACRKFHADNVTLRLLCTYAGPGTEWIPDADAVRDNLARRDVDVATANRSVLRRPHGLRRCGVGDVIVLKGDAFEGNRGRGAVHRSPPIEDRGQSRLVFKLDEHPCGC